VQQVRDPFFRAFWTKEFAQYDPRFLREAVAPIQNKLGQLLLSPLLRNVLGQVRTRVFLRFMMDTRRVLIVNLAKGKLGAEPANLLGALLAAQFQHAAMTRADLAESERADSYLIIDEFHKFSTDSFAPALAEARKFLQARKSKRLGVRARSILAKDEKTGAVTDPNRDDDPEYIILLIKRVVSVPIDTVRIVNELPSPF